MYTLLNELVQQNAPPQPSCEAALFPFAIMFIIFYFLILRPQKKREDERKAMLSRLKKGDRVLTSGGLIGTIHAVEPHEIVVEVADKVRVRVLRDDVDLYTSSSAELQTPN